MQMVLLFVGWTSCASLLLGASWMIHERHVRGMELTIKHFESQWKKLEMDL